MEITKTDGTEKALHALIRSILTNEKLSADELIVNVRAVKKADADALTKSLRAKQAALAAKFKAAGIPARVLGPRKAKGGAA